jgi:tellurite resistance protein TerC
VRAAINITYRYARRIVIGLVGATVLLVGVIMIVTPGPAFVVIPVGLAILGLEFAWARRWLQKVRERISAETSKRRSRNAARQRGDTLEP